MKIKVLSISIIVSICAFFGMNVFADYFQGFWYELEIAKRPELIRATIGQQAMERQIGEMKLTKNIITSLNEAGVNSRAAISSQGETELFSINGGDKLAIASITKLMTAVVVFDNYELDLLIPITQESVEEEGASRYGNILSGENLTVESLLYTMLIESSNDAAYALTGPVGFEAFVDLMNIQAKKIGMTDTYFVNPNGLEPDDPEETKNYSTARDLVKLANYILKEYPEIFEITTNNTYRVLKPNGYLHHVIGRSTNKLLGEIPEIIGGKTGWSPAAGGCLLVVIKDEKGNNYINVILGASDRFAEMRKIISSIQND